MIDQPMARERAATATHTATTTGHYRWVICALLFFAATINYVDRAVLGVLAPTLVRRVLSAVLVIVAVILLVRG